MAPPLAALAAIGALSLWRRVGDRGWKFILLPIALLATGAWQFFIVAEFPEPPPVLWSNALTALLFAGTTAAILALLEATPRWPRLAVAGFGIGLVAVLAAPAAWALSTVVVPGHVEFPAAGAWQPTAVDDPAIRDARNRQIKQLLAFLRANRHGERFLVATPDARRASRLIIASGEAVLALGGYGGGDLILTPESLAAMVARREVRFVMVLSDDERGPRVDRNAALTNWIRENGRPVDPMLWRATRQQPAEDAAAAIRPPSRHGPRGLALLRLYDLAPAEDAAAPVSQ